MRSTQLVEMSLRCQRLWTEHRFAWQEGWVQCQRHQKYFPWNQKWYRVLSSVKFLGMPRIKPGTPAVRSNNATSVPCSSRQWKTLLVFFTAADEGQGSQNNRSWRFGEHFFLLFIFKSSFLVEARTKTGRDLQGRRFQTSSKVVTWPDQTFDFKIFNLLNQTFDWSLSAARWFHRIYWPLERAQLCGSIEMAKIQEGRYENDY